MSEEVKPVELYYLMLHDESDTVFICTVDEVDGNLDLGCFIISQSYALTNLITQGLKEAKDRGFSFEGYKQMKHKNKEVTVKAGTVNPVQLKFKKK